jgi:hypothetical protein
MSTESPVHRLVMSHGLARVRFAGQAGLDAPAVVQLEGKQTSQLERKGTTVRVRVGGGWPWQKAGTAIVLATELEWELEASGGMSHVQGALEDVHFRSLTFSGGASNVELALGRPRGVCTIRLSGGASHLVIRRPKNVGVRLTLSGGVAHLALDDFFFSAASGKIRMETPNCAAAANRYELQISGGASHLQIRS